MFGHSEFVSYSVEWRVSGLLVFEFLPAAMHLSDYVLEDRILSSVVLDFLQSHSFWYSGGGHVVDVLFRSP